MILPAQQIRALQLVEPFCERSKHEGMSYGLSSAGYDVRVAEDHTLRGGMFCLASTIERFKMPNNVIGFVHDKSTWARKGLAVQNTVIEPGWEGFLTIELTNHCSVRTDCITITRGMPIAQIVFHWLSEPTEQPYNGKYQNQEEGPQAPRYEV